MPTILDAGLLTETLKALPGWQGDSHAIWRDLTLDPSVDAELRRQVAVDGGAMGHPPEVQDRGDGVTRYTLSTDGGVSELDIAFASHLSDLAHRIAATEPGIDAVRAGDPIVIFRAGEDPAES